MIITQTPYRISFFGGGTDYMPHYIKYGGCALSTTIDKYCYLNVRKLPPFFDHGSHIVYSKVENVNAYDEIQHPVVRESMRYLKLEKLSILHDGDLPARAGLGTSSAFTVGLLNALHALRGEYVDKMALAKEAIYMEHDVLKENVGVQDQIAVAMGGLNCLKFTADDFQVEPLVILPERKKLLNDHLMLFFTGIHRVASDVAGEQVKNTPKKTQELLEMASMVEVAKNILATNVNIADFGRLLHESWLLKRSLTNKISNSSIDSIYDTALKNGAIGGKLLGAGGGGFILLFVPPENQAIIKKSLSKFLYVPFAFEDFGSRVLYYKS
ncbi:GHMP family kinase ATP-binding protein [Anaerosinus massiliensis]|uniref:GHMP family kinase ATP-binding protein n=1 Tax=Massilibacillus massiliensis TaxID=1806837 RepID=UPI000AB12AB5|nr:kinase [Massilibacillus massiliensis]